MEFKILEDGKEIKCKSIIMFKDDSNNINYIVYKEENNDEIFASRYNIVDGSIILQAIEQESEWNLIDNMLEKSDRK